MSAPELFVVGTIRSRQGGGHLVVTATGERFQIRLETDGTPPALGSDVVGLATASPKGYTMRLVPDVAKEILRGHVVISAHGRSDVTARMLARMLDGARPGVLTPGVGGTIERTPTMSDADAGWAFSELGGLASSLGVALNVVDPVAAAHGDWSRSRLKDDFLPADAIGERDALEDIHDLFLAGMSPTCRRTFEPGPRNSLVPSVDFVVPYSPFLTGMGYSARVARAFKDEVVRVPLSGDFARKISSWREMVQPFASRYLGRVRGTAEAVRQMEQTFADVSVTLALCRGFGAEGRDAALAYARLREASVARWNGYHEAPVGSHEAIGIAVATAQGGFSGVVEELEMAASIARSNSPSSTKDLLALRARSDGQAFFKVADMKPAQTRLIQHGYAEDIAGSMERLSGSHSATERYVRYLATFEMPYGWESFRDYVMEPVVESLDPSQTFADEGIVMGARPEAARP